MANIAFQEGIRHDVQEFVKSYTTCQINTHSALKPAGLLQPLPVPNQVFEDLMIDFIGELPTAKGFDTIFVVVDKLTKYSHFILLSYPFSAKEVATVFMKEIVKLHGFP